MSVNLYKNGDLIPIAGNGGGVEVDAELSAESENPVQNKAIAQKISELESGISQANNAFSKLKDVAKTGSYNDLTDKPSIPEAVIVDSELSDSANPVQNRAITKKINAIDAEMESVKKSVSDGKDLDHRNTYRGKSLGTSVSEAQKAAIQNGTFEDLYIGDYWTIEGVDWMIADMDYWYNCGNTAFTKHHLVIIPRVALYNAQMNPTNTTNGGYVGSTMYTTNLTEAKTKITKAFGDLVLTHKEYLVNAVANGKPSARAWVNSSVELPNECMMYGHPHFAPVSDGSTVPTLHTISKTQLTLFRLRPELIVDRAHSQWLRDVVSSAYFARVNYNGDANYGNASVSLGVRPVFPIG